MNKEELEEKDVILNTVLPYVSQQNSWDISLSQLLFLEKGRANDFWRMLILKQKILKTDSLGAFGFTTTEQGYEFRKHR